MLPEDSSRLAFWTIGAVLGAVVAYVVYRFVGTFVFGLFIYYVTRPVYRRVRRRVGPPSLAAAGSLFLLTLPGV
ncbi:MAG: AI-2E family transporter, partial [Halobacteriales archaeon]